MTKTFELGRFSKDYLISWNVLTQAGFLSNTKLVAGDKTYFSYDKESTFHHLQMLGNGSAKIETDDPLQLIITVHSDYEIKSAVVAGSILDQRAREVGYVYNFCIEDFIDDDYNDIYVDIVGWKSL